MKRMMPLTLAVVGCLAGYLMPHPSALAQAPASPPGQRGGQGQGRGVQIFTIDGSKYPRAENGKGVIWTGDELRKKYVIDPNAPGSDHLQWAPPYRISIQRRQAPQPGATVSGELHDDKTQIYVIIGGAGTVQLGGRVDADNSAGPGEHRGGPLLGATSHHVKEGDVVSIPPMTWHASYADPGQVLTYLMVHVENRQTIP
jgi:mannose-6-phosphate isomerase-like protein (cupin superfamily)